MTSSRRYLAGRVRALTRRRSPRVVIIGAGFGGLAAAVALRRKGIDDLLIIERADGVGGTWRQNIYPGAACDIQSHLYSFSFAPNRAWSRTYANQPEILAYLESVADDFDLRRHLMLGTSVRRLVWNEDALHWEVKLDSDGADRTVVADVVVSAVGLFHSVRYPDIKGLADFSGDVMHTAQWDAAARPDRKTGGSRRHGRKWRAGRTRAGRYHSEIDSLPAHAALDGAKAGPPLQRRRACTFPSIPVGLASGALAAVEAAARQHRADPRPSAAGGHSGDIGELPAEPRRGRGATRRADTPLSIPVQACPAWREVLHRTATRPRGSRDGSDRTHHQHVSCHSGRRRHRCRRLSAGDRVRNQQLPIWPRHHRRRRRKSAQPLGFGPARLSRRGRQRLPEFLHVVRPKYQSGRQLDHLHPGGRRADGGERGGPSRATGRVPRRASGRRTSVQRTDFRRSGADHMDTLRQLLPVAYRAHRHSMAAFGTRLCPGDVAATAKKSGFTR